MNPTPLPPDGPNPHRQPSREEVFELGLLAVEDTPDEVVHPPAASMPSPTLNPPPLPTAGPTTLPSRAAPVAPPQLSAPSPPLDLSKPKPVAPVARSAGAKATVVERMDISANSMHIRSLSKLRFLSTLLYVLILAMALGVVLGGWIIYKHLVGGGNLF